MAENRRVSLEEIKKENIDLVSSSFCFVLFVCLINDVFVFRFFLFCLRSLFSGFAYDIALIKLMEDCSI